MNKRTWIGALALMLAFAAVLAGCGGKSVEQLTKESLKLEEELAQLDPSNAKDAAKMAKLAAETLKLAAELEKAEAKAAGKPAKPAKGSGKARPAGEFQYDLTADGKGILIKGFTGAGGNVVVPEKIEDIPVVEIGDSAFAGDDGTSLSFVGDTAVSTKTGNTNSKNGITAITLPNTVKKIGGNAFSYTAITKFVMPDSVTEIGRRGPLDLFSNCEALTEVHLSDSIETIPDSLFGFKGSKSLKKINLPKSLKRIGFQAFTYLGELNELVIPPELTSVEFGKVDPWEGWTTKGESTGADNAFEGCGKLPIKTRQTIQGWGYKGKF